MVEWKTITQADDVTPEILDAVQSAYDGWYSGDDDRIDWVDLLDRVDGMELSTGERLDLGDSMSTPAIRRIKRYISDYRRGK